MQRRSSGIAEVAFGVMLTRAKVERALKELVRDADRGGASTPSACQRSGGGAEGGGGVG